MLPAPDSLFFDSSKHSPFYQLVFLTVSPSAVIPEALLLSVEMDTKHS